MAQHRRRPHAPAALVLVLVLATACGPAEEAGTASKTAPAPSPSVSATATANGVARLRAGQILRRARKATAAARYLRMRGRIEDGKDKIAIDFRYAGKTEATGWFQTGKQRVEITRIGRDIYVKGNDPFWKSIGGKAAVQLLSGKYLKTTTKTPDFKDIGIFTERTGLLNEALKAPGTWKKGETGTAGGTPAVSLTRAPGETIQVATQGEPYVLALTGGPGNGVEYLAYEEPVDVRRPPAGTVVDGDAFK
ncbi:hypothetical protein [Spirillospora sp. CA-128828]|uniref:hypothetical protein n=1 Tax=Spirillospora sp. CA-128828 TaxID=3240033 RepID=UPI003D94C068